MLQRQPRRRCLLKCHDVKKPCLPPRFYDFRRPLIPRASVADIFRRVAGIRFDRPNLSLMCRPCPELPLAERNIAGSVCPESPEIAEPAADRPLLYDRSTGCSFKTSSLIDA